VTTWSFSSIKLFVQCPYKFYRIRVARDVKDEMGEAAVYGDEVHKAAEAAVKTGTPIPKKYGYMEPIVGALAALPGDKHTELKFGVKLTDKGFAPCDFFDKEVWFRGIVDFLNINGPLGHQVDYKTGKPDYADTRQLDLMAAASFIHFPQLDRIKSGLAFVVHDKFIKKAHFAEHTERYMNVFSPDLDRLTAAEETGVWNKNPSGLCGWCPVKDCEHWKDRKR
jgi:hypothetical protein